MQELLAPQESRNCSHGSCREVGEKSHTGSSHKLGQPLFSLQPDGHNYQIVSEDGPSEDSFYYQVCKPSYSTLVMPLLEISAAAAVDAVGTIPAGTPGFERCTSLHATSTQQDQ